MTPGTRRPRLRPPPLAATLLLAGASGGRSLVGVAALSRALASARSQRSAEALQPATFLARTDVARVSAAAAALEFIGDKLPGIPDRTAPLPLAGRALTGAVVGAAIAADAGRDRRVAAVVGAAAAIAGAFVGFHARRRLNDVVDPMVAAVIEDSLILSMTALGVAALAGDR